MWRRTAQNIGFNVLEALDVATNPVLIGFRKTGQNRMEKTGCCIRFFLLEVTLPYPDFVLFFQPFLAWLKPKFIRDALLQNLSETTSHLVFELCKISLAPSFYKERKIFNLWYKVVWAAREDARQFLHPHPRGRAAWKAMRSACAYLQEVIAAGVVS